MPLEIQTIYNAATLNYRYKEKLDSYKNARETKNLNCCREFTNDDLNTAGDKQKICEAVILFLSHLKEETENSTYRDNGCKYLFYWLYTYLKSNDQPIKNTLKLYKQLYKIYKQNNNGLDIFDNYINEINERTSEKLVKLTDMYDKLDNFYEGRTSLEPEKKCNSGVSELYAKYLNECINGYDDHFCDELKNFRKKHNYIIQSVQLCQGEQYLLPPVEKFDTVDKTIIPLTLIPLTSLILPILYKFTALGPWIRHLIGKNKNVLDNINEEPDQLLYTNEMGGNNSMERYYNIAYNSS